MSAQPIGSCSVTHMAEGEPHSPLSPVKPGFQTACGSSRLIGSTGAMQKPTLWLRTTSDLCELSRV